MLLSSKKIISELVVETLAKSAAVGKDEISITAAKAEKVAEDLQEITESVAAVREALTCDVNEDEIEAEYHALRLPEVPKIALENQSDKILELA
jgi:hypothetical protein